MSLRRGSATALKASDVVAARGISTSYSHHGMCQADPDARADVSSRTQSRCSWAGDDPLMQAYHDEEWGVPQRDPRALWEMLMLEGFQAGFSWAIVLRKRDGFRKAFARFDPRAVVRFTARDVNRLLTNPDIIRARAKIEATIAGARVFREM